MAQAPNRPWRKVTAEYAEADRSSVDVATGSVAAYDEPETAVEFEPGAEPYHGRESVSLADADTAVWPDASHVDQADADADADTAVWGAVRDDRDATAEDQLEAPTSRIVPVITKGLRVLAGAGSAESRTSRRERAERRREEAKLVKKQRAIGLTIATTFGEVIITIGLFFALFAFWQLYWTDVQASRVQAVESAKLEASGWTKASPTVKEVRHTQAPPVDEAPATGEFIARLHIPRFAKDYDRIIVQGVDKADVLDQVGIGHYPATQMPGELGNFAIAGHRATFSRPFNKVPDFKEGDAIIVESRTVWYVYRMTSHELVPPTQGNVIYPVPGGSLSDEPTERLLTITTCHPEWGSKERWIVHAKLDYWMYKTEGTPPEASDRPS